MSSFSGDETAPFFAFLGAAAFVFSCIGAPYGTAKSGVGAASMGVMRPGLVMKSIVPVVVDGVLGIYGLIIAVIISTGINPKAKPYYLFDGYAHLSSGLACLSAGMAIGVVGDIRRHLRANAQQPKLFVGMILIPIFAGAVASVWPHRRDHPVLSHRPIKSRLKGGRRTRGSSGRHPRVEPFLSILILIFYCIYRGLSYFLTIFYRTKSCFPCMLCCISLLVRFCCLCFVFVLES